MKKLLCIILVLRLGIDACMAQSYDAMWKQVEQSQQSDLPRQVLSQSEAIYKKAVKEHNFAQMMKAWVSIADAKSSIDPDSCSIDLLPKAEYKGAVQEAIYHAIMGSAYQSMNMSSVIMNDTEALERNEQLAKEHFSQVLKDKDALATETVDKYLPLVNKGEDSRIYGHDLLMMLTRFMSYHSSLTTEEKANMYGSVADYYKQHGNNEGWALARMWQLEWMSKIEDANKRLNHADYVNELKQLVEQTKANEVGVDIALKYMPYIQTDSARLEYARWAQKQFSTSKLNADFINTERTLMRGSCSVNVDRQLLSNREFTIKLTHKNIQSARLEVRKYNGLDSKKQLRTDGNVVQTRTYTIDGDEVNKARRANNYLTHGTWEDKMTLPAGRYVFVLKAADTSSVVEVDITTLHVVATDLPNNQLLVYVADHESGRPVEGATVVYEDKNGTSHSARTDAKGETILQGEIFNNLYAKLSDDNYTAKIHVYRSTSQSDDSENLTGNLYTDRAIYRPGHVVHASGWLSTNENNRMMVVPNRDCKLTLYDANNEEIGSKELTTNEYGSFATDFTLPASGLTGQFSLRLSTDKSSDMTTRHIRVEEYKRPTFTVSASPYNPSDTDSQALKEFSIGDTVKVQALVETFTHIPVRGAVVKYRIETASMDFWRRMHTLWKELDRGELTTDDNGLAVTSVYLDSLDLNQHFNDLVSYRITFDATDMAGETQSGEYTIAVSRRGFDLRMDVPRYYDLAKKKPITISARNAANKSVSATGLYNIYHATDKEGTHSLYEGQFNTDSALTLPSLPFGSYYIECKATDKNGNEIEALAGFELFDSEDAIIMGTKRYAPETAFDHDFCYIPSHTYFEQKPVTLYFSPADDDVIVHYLILTKEKLLEHKTFNLNKNLYRLDIDYRSEFGPEIWIVTYCVKNGEAFHDTYNFTYEEPSKRLKLSWKSFRDKLIPGQKEEWTLNVTNAQGKTVDGAEVLAAMFDASLDKLYKHHWDVWLPYPPFYHGYFIRSSNSYYADNWLRATAKLNLLKLSGRQWDELTQYVRGYSYMSRAGGVMPLMARMKKLEGRVAGLDLVEDVAVNTAMMVIPVSETSSEPDIDMGQMTASGSSVIRTNFDETAFFYPHLVSDAKGDVRISFTLPESLTEWRFMGIAHTKDVHFGQIDTTIVARKEFMVQPNMPRFVREGDEVSLSSRIMNESDKDVEAVVRLRIMDAETEKVIATDIQTVRIEARKTASATFTFKATDEYPMLICEVTAESETFGDGERNYLPVLTDKQYVTETIPFYTLQGETGKTVDLHTLFNNNSKTATNRNMTIDYTANPAWTIVEALDAVKVPERDDATTLAAALYSNVMARQLALQFPEIGKQAGREVSSSLYDDDLKDILLHESPWLQAAKKEVEQRKNIAEFLNESLINQRLTSVRERLAKLQNKDGAWSWFGGMDGSYYVTLMVCESLAGISNDTEVADMYAKAMNYLDNEELKKYNNKKKSRTTTPSESTLRYLYICSLTPQRKVSGDVKSMRDVYVKELKKAVKDLSIYGKATAASVLRAFGEVKAANDFTRSILEYSIEKPGMGRYFNTDKAEYSWMDYRIPTHIAAMKAIKESAFAAEKPELLTNMTLWLMRQKQMQKWDNPVNTINAVSLLMTDGDANNATRRNPAEFDNITSEVSFSLNGTKLTAPADTANFLAEQLGYVKVQVPADIANAGANELSIQTQVQENAVAWGAVYAQYLEDMKNIGSHSAGELKIQRKIMKDGKEIKDRTALAVGDKVTVRLTLTATQDMDFVQVRTQHPACFEPVSQLSGYRWMGGTGGYVSMHDASADLFFDNFRRGSATIDIEFTVTRTGTYLSGTANAQCAYAPAISAHTDAMTITVK